MEVLQVQRSKESEEREEDTLQRARKVRVLFTFAIAAFLAKRFVRINIAFLNAQIRPHDVQHDGQGDVSAYPRHHLVRHRDRQVIRVLQDAQKDVRPRIRRKGKHVKGCSPFSLKTLKTP